MVWGRQQAAGLAVSVVLLAGGRDASAQLRSEVFAGGFTQPVAFVQDPSDPSVQVIVQQDGRIRAVRDGVVQSTDFLDLRSVVRNSGEQGLLGLAFAPDYAASGRVYVNFSDLSGDTVVARFLRSAADPLRADPASRFDFRWPGGQRVVSQPFSNHNGGNMAFGPDGFLYIGMGDGGSGNDPFHFAQNPQSLLGKMLRLNVAVPASDAEGYDVPPSNPFVGQAGVLGEIWSFGLRNPWRWSFDDPSRGGTGALVIGDVGQTGFEEIDYEPAGRGGRNYGWRNREGAHDNVTSLPPFSLPLTDPIFEYARSEGRAITGGSVYRGAALGSAFRGRYFFGDFITSRVWSIRLTVSPTTGEATASDLVEHTAELGAAAQSPASFGVDASGELFVVSYAGAVHRILSTLPPEPDPGPGPGPDPGPTLGAGARPRPPGVEPIGRAIRRAEPATAFGALMTALVWSARLAPGPCVPDEHEAAGRLLDGLGTAPPADGVTEIIGVFRSCEAGRVVVVWLEFVAGAPGSGEGPVAIVRDR
ncbi:MAG TPA: PQQ-dependent sugar dehydrogenase [Vicinamibacterales bacterium]|nr:PQQ-dependent sugar dehydrogenase [Vicinamibacterales bacterium]